MIHIQKSFTSITQVNLEIPIGRKSLMALMETKQWYLGITQSNSVRSNSVLDWDLQRTGQKLGKGWNMHGHFVTCHFFIVRIMSIDHYLVGRSIIKRIACSGTVGCSTGVTQQDPGHGGLGGSPQDTGYGCSLPTRRSRSKGRGEFMNPLHTPWETRYLWEHRQT